MSHGPFRNLILARALAVEPIAKALCPDPLSGRPSGRPGDRWQRTARRAAFDRRSWEPGEQVPGADDENLP
jgi:hypothetical protein